MLVLLHIDDVDIVGKRENDIKTILLSIFLKSAGNKTKQIKEKKNKCMVKKIKK